MAAVRRLCRLVLSSCAASRPLAPVAMEEPPPPTPPPWDIDAAVGHDPYKLLLLLSVLALAYHHAASAFVRRWDGSGGSQGGQGGAHRAASRRLAEAEHHRHSAACVRAFLHRCFLVACVVATARTRMALDEDAYAFFKEYTLYVWTTAMHFFLRTALGVIERALEQAGVAAVCVKTAATTNKSIGKATSNGGKTNPRGLGEQQQEQLPQAPPSCPEVALFILGSLAAVHAFAVSQLPATAPPSLGRLYPLAIYDSVLLLLYAARRLGLRYGAMQEDEDEVEVEEEQDVGADSAKDTDDRGCGKHHRHSRRSPRRRGRGHLPLGRAQAEALLQHCRFHLRFASAVLLLVQHVHVWALKGFRAFQGADGIDMVLLLQLQHILYRVLFSARAYSVYLTVTALIERRFASAGEAQLAALDSDDVCSICLRALAPGTDVKQLPCKHLLHAGCLLKCLERSTLTGGGGGGGGGGHGHDHGSSSGGGDYGARCPLCRRCLLTPAAAEDDKAAKPASAAGSEGEELPQDEEEEEEEAPAIVVSRTRTRGPWARARGSWARARGLARPPSEEAAAVAAEAAAGEGTEADGEDTEEDDEAAAAAAGGEGEEEEEHERPLFRFSTEELPAWLPLPLPAFSLEVVRRPARTTAAVAGRRRERQMERGRAVAAGETGP